MLTNPSSSAKGKFTKSDAKSSTPGVTQFVATLGQQCQLPNSPSQGQIPFATKFSSSGTSCSSCLLIPYLFSYLETETSLNLTEFTSLS